MAGNETARRHSRDDVVEAALRILDDLGLPDLTMRRLAAALDVQPSALYWHFPNKQTLLAELADRIVAARRVPVAVDSRGADPRAGDPATVDPAADWRDAVRSEAAALRDALLAYRDGAEVVSSTLALGLGSPETVDRLARAVARGGFDPETSRRAATALLHFVLGHVSHEQQRLQYDSLGVLADGDRSPFDEDDPAAAFAFGVDLLVGGLELSRSRT
ncbi:MULTISPECIES: TetR/AcrR family transcriptional regulator C-terminal domain-containing protein [unclassified Leifsonia]|uniref:TetR/AcrR family transcriptional regulator C-terminal domain-containing protein n=1 Tax=unclassified Leifsonia TaxID=2663824 RepID=UPI0008A7E251|nr:MULTISPECIES: TetR/AcrR family transcriptional regulator C-terminal domain-containing protein [unclassified Leifsonia]SEH67211.1 DNA-binding transcriptional regulator, AcrR family [Leifsonia sp. CL154]SFL28879.1 DNA-binding transcriptional regulator, AcrR family [Leifsonia sp. CL147]